MAKNNNLEDFLQDIANTIKTKKGITGTINAQDFSNEIATISGGTTYNNYVVFNKLPQVKAYLDTDIVSLPANCFRIGANFGYANSLKEIHLPTVTIINAYALGRNESLTTAYLPLVSIIQGGNSFDGCVALTSIELPSITSLSGGSFNGCTALTSVTIGTNASTTLCTLTGTNAFANTPIATSETSGFIYVADSLVEQYKTADNWSTYATKIKGISEK